MNNAGTLSCIAALLRTVLTHLDSLAYFGFGVKLILNYGWIVNDDGTMSDHPLSPRRWPIDAVLGAA